MLRALIANQRSCTSLPNIFPSQSSLLPAQNTSTARTVAAAGPSTGKGGTQFVDQCSVVARLAKGEGITLSEWTSVVETCEGYQRVYLEAGCHGALALSSSSGLLTA
jgi:hypothetical protein